MTDEGTKLSLVYPKKTYDVSINFKADDLNQHNLNIPGMLSAFGKYLRNRFRNPFRAAATTTTESSHGFENEVTDDGTDSWSSSDNGDSSSKKGEYDGTDNEYTPDDMKTGYVYSTSTNDYSLETVPISYLPPGSTYLGPFVHMPSTDSYLPPPTSKPDVNYLPSN